jgi:hypothetical protein
MYRIDIRLPEEPAENWCEDVAAYVHALGGTIEAGWLYDEES